METILIGEKETKEYVDEAKNILEKENEVMLKGISRDTVKVVDVAELLKIEGFKVKDIKIETEEANEKRNSVMFITLGK